MNNIKRWLQNYFVTKFRYFPPRRGKQAKDSRRSRATAKIISRRLDEVLAENSKLQ